MKEEEEQIDKLMIDYQKNSNREIANENLKKLKQKRKLSQDFEEENKHIQENHKNSILKEKEEDKNYMQEYSKKLKEDEEKRLFEKHSILSKLKSFTSQEFYSKFIDINDLMKKEIQIKNENDLDFTVRCKLLQENKLQNKLFHDLNETKKILKSQIESKNEEKFKSSKSNKEEKIKLEEYMKRQDADNKNKLLKRMLSFQEYKKSLEEQIKNKKKEQFMNDEERKMNKIYL